MDYEKLYEKHFEKWFSGAFGKIGSYTLSLSGGIYSLDIWVEDRRYFNKRKTKEIYTTDSAIDMDNYLTANNPK